MFCRNCGNEVGENAEFCVKCGVRPLNGKKYCQSCGVETRPDQEVCVKCGVRLRVGVRASKGAGAGQKDWLITLLLCLFLGYLGVHRFYTGHTSIGIAQLFTAGGCWIWTIIDLIMIITGDFKDAEGLPLKKSW